MAYQILPGSLEIDGNTITAGVHTGASEWDIQNLRYVRTQASDPTQTVLTILSEAYDSTGGTTGPQMPE